MSRYFNILDDNYIPKTKLKEMLKMNDKNYNIGLNFTKSQFKL